MPTENNEKNLKIEGFNYSEQPKKIHYFPRGLDEYFPSLKVIKIKFAGLKEIHQNDLKSFTELEVLNLYQNEIEIIEENLFKFNLKLRAISFEMNKIYYVEIQSLKMLENLKSLYIGVVCINEGIKNKEKSEFDKLFMKIEHSCSNQNYKIIKEIKEIKKVHENFGKSLDKIKNSSEDESESELRTKNISIFIAVPIVCLMTILNVGLIILCFRERITFEIEKKIDEM